MQFKILFSLMLIISYSTLKSQQNSVPIQPSWGSARGVQIGEDVPDVIMPKMVSVDGKVSSGSLSDYKDKLLILDLMNTRCRSCVDGLVEKNKLQDQFGDKIKILVVVGGEQHYPGMLRLDNEAYIRTYLTSQNYLSYHQVKIPWVVESQALNDTFPHRVVSHLVWIYKGKLVAITEQDYVTAENIQLVLDGKRNNWPVKNDFLPAFDNKIPMIDQYPSRFSRLIAKNEHTVVFGAFKDGAFPKRGSVIDSTSRTRRDYHINMPLVNLYWTYWLEASNVSRYVQPSQIILEVKDPWAYVEQEDDKQYDYVRRQKINRSVEFRSLDTGQTKAQQALHFIMELDNVLGLKGRYEKRKMQCLILYRTDNLERFKSKSQEPYDFIRSNLRSPNIHFDRTTLESIVFKMNKFYGNPPVFDETGYKGLIDVKFTLNSWTDIPAVRAGLKPYGLDLRSEERELEVLVLTEL